MKFYLLINKDETVATQMRNPKFSFFAFLFDYSMNVEIAGGWINNDLHQSNLAVGVGYRSEYCKIYTHGSLACSLSVLENQTRELLRTTNTTCTSLWVTTFTPL